MEKIRDADASGYTHVVAIAFGHDGADPKMIDADQPLPVAIADGGLATMGAKADAAWDGAAASPSGVSIWKRLAALLAGTLTIANAGNIFWNGATGAGSALAAGATFTGAARDTGVAQANGHRYAYFNAFYLADQAGTVYIDASNDGSTWYPVASQALTANTPATLTTPITTRYYRARVVNGATLQGSLYVNSSFTAA